jgi:hypothetical protein
MKLGNLLVLDSADMERVRAMNFSLRNLRMSIVQQGNLEQRLPLP